MNVDQENVSLKNEEIAKEVVVALTKKSYTGHYAPTKNAAKELVINLIPTYSTVGFGGSVTTRELGLVEALQAQGHQVFDHWQLGLSQEEILAIRRKQVVSDVFLTSANAITLEGEIVNVDGYGNRIAASIFGPKIIIMIVGVNKITDNLSAALERSQRVAAVTNAQRLKTTTPCNITGECNDCASPDRICNITVIQHRRPAGKHFAGDYHVIVVGEKIGY